MLNAVQYAAKRSAFWCKAQGKMVQNAVRFGAKCSAKCSRMQDKKQTKPFRTMKDMAEKGKTPVKKWDFRV